MAKKPSKPKRPRPARTTSLKNAPPKKAKVQAAVKALKKGTKMLNAAAKAVERDKAKASKVQARRDKVSETTWKRLYALRDTYRTSEAAQKRDEKEMKEVSEKLEVLTLALPERKTLALKEHELRRSIKDHKSEKKHAVINILDLIDQAEEGTLFEGGLKEKKDEAKPPLFDGASPKSDPAPTTQTASTGSAADARTPTSSNDFPFSDIWPRAFDFYNGTGERIKGPTEVSHETGLESVISTVCADHKIEHTHRMKAGDYGLTFLNGQAAVLRVVRVPTAFEQRAAKRAKQREEPVAA